MTSIPTQDNAGQIFEFEKCGHCGGFLFSGSDLFRLTNAEAKKNDISSPQKIDKELTCPTCHQKITKIIDPYIPKTIDLFRCTSCNSYFIPAGHLTKYKNYQNLKFKSHISPRESVVLTTVAWLAFFATWTYLYFLEKGPLSIYAEGIEPKISPTAAFLNQNYLFLISSAAAVIGLTFYLFSRRFKNIILILVFLLSLAIFGAGIIYR